MHRTVCDSILNPKRIADCSTPKDSVLFGIKRKNQKQGIIFIPLETFADGCGLELKIVVRFRFKLTRREESFKEGN